MRSGIAKRWVAAVAATLTTVVALACSGSKVVEAPTVGIAATREVAAVSARVEYSPETQEIIDSYQGPYLRGVDPRDYPSHVWDGPRPTTFYEAPMLTELVKQGKLPPLEERLPHVDDIYFVRPLQELGIYGGTSRTLGGLNIVQVDADAWCTKPDTDGETLLPWICKNWTLSEDGRQYTYTLRRDHKWSDGSVFDTEDVRFAWEDLNFNDEYTGFIPARYRDPVTGNRMVVDIVDDLTFTFTFDTPVFDLMEARVGDADCFYWCFYTPDTYSKQFHPKYSDLKAELKTGNYRDWTQWFKVQHDVRRIVDFPWLGAFVTCEPSERRRSICRNAYFNAVDPAGNQLPYIDKWTSYFFESPEVAIFRAMKGEEDNSGRIYAVDLFRLYKANMEKGDYSIISWDTTSMGGNANATSFNQTFNSDPEIGRLMRTRDFRLAYSHAINRPDMVETLYLGMGEPRNLLPLVRHPYYPGADLETVDLEYDPELANKLLDSVGLVDTDGDGIRNRKDGKGNLTLYTGSEGPNNNYLNLSVADLAEVGITLKWREIPRYYRVIRANDGYIGPGRGGCGFSGWGGAPSIPPMVWWSHCGPEIGTFIETKGRDGMGPTGPDPKMLPLAPEGTYPADTTGLMMELEGKWLEGRGYRRLDPRRIELGKEIFRANVEAKYGWGVIASTPQIRIKRNNFRNIPDKSQARGWAGGWPETYYFEDGIDNINHPANRSKLYKSTSFR